MYCICGLILNFLWYHFFPDPIPLKGKSQEIWFEGFCTLHWYFSPFSMAQYWAVQWRILNFENLSATLRIIVSSDIDKISSVFISGLDEEKNLSKWVYTLHKWLSEGVSWSQALSVGAFVLKIPASEPRTQIHAPLCNVPHAEKDAQIPPLVQ